MQLSVPPTRGKRQLQTLIRRGATLLAAGALCAGIATVGPAITAEAAVNPPGSTIRFSQTFYAYLNAGENLDVSFVRLANGWDTTIKVTDPQGGTNDCFIPDLPRTGGVGGVGPQTCSFDSLTSSTTGIWTIDFIRPSGPGINPQGEWSWSIVAQDGNADIPGRVWTDKFVMQNSTNIDVDLWYVGSAGYQYAVRHHQFYGIDSTFDSDQFGNLATNTCIPAYRSITNRTATVIPIDYDPNFSGPNSACGVPYHIFFERPAADLPGYGVDGSGNTRFIAPTVASPKVVDFTFAADAPGSRVGVFSLEIADHIGSAQLLIDVDGDGSFDGPRDRVIPVTVEDAASQAIPFDGLDGQGQPILPETAFTAKVQISQAGEIHFISDDVEGRDGLSVESINGQNPGNTLLYWNDSYLNVSLRDQSCIPPVLDGTTGVDSAVAGGVHGWPCPAGNPNDGTGPWGDIRSIDDWTYNTVDVADSITVAAETGGYTVRKSSAPGSGTDVAPGDVVKYTIDVAQEGTVPVPAELVDDLSEVFDDAKYNDDAVADTGAVAVAGNSLTWTGSLPVGGTARITYSVTVGDGSQGDGTLRNVVTSPGCTDQCETTHAIVTHTIGSYLFGKSSDPISGSTVKRGDVVTYTVTVTGVGSVTNAVVKDDMSELLDDATYNGDLSATSGSAVHDEGNIVWTGDLNNGESVTWSYSVTVNGDGDRQLRNLVVTDDPRGSCDLELGCETKHLLSPPPGLAATGASVAMWMPIGAMALIGAGLATVVVVRRSKRPAPSTNC